MGTLGDDSAQVFSMLSGTLSTYLWPSASAMQSAAATSVLSSRHAWKRVSGQGSTSHHLATSKCSLRCPCSDVIRMLDSCLPNLELSFCPTIRRRASSNLVGKVEAHPHNTHALKLGEAVFYGGHRRPFRRLCIIPVPPCCIRSSNSI